MPSRTITLAIIAFWLLTAGWFVVRDVQLFSPPDAPPPYSIEYSDEVQRQVNVPNRWTCTLRDVKVGTVSTVQSHEPADDTFEFLAKSKRLTFLEMTMPHGGQITASAVDYDDRVRVTRDGELRAMYTQVVLVIEGVGPPITARLELAAEVRGGRLERRFSLEAPGIGRISPQLASTDPPRGSVLNPMHPVPRISGLHPGQTWRQPLTDPRTDILRAALAELLPGKLPLVPEAPAALQARVLLEPQTLVWPGERHLCHVIEYRDGEEYVARTWVRIADGAVLRQEAGAHGEMLVLQRE